MVPYGRTGLYLAVFGTSNEKIKIMENHLEIFAILDFINMLYVSYTSELHELQITRLTLDLSTIVK
jgi:hypothetical protein